MKLYKETQLFTKIFENSVFTYNCFFIQEFDPRHFIVRGRIPAEYGRGGRGSGKGILILSNTYFNIELLNAALSKVIVKTLLVKILIERCMDFSGSGRDSKSLKIQLDNRRERQLQRAAGGSASSSVVMNQIKVYISYQLVFYKHGIGNLLSFQALFQVVRGAAIGKDFIMRSIGQYVDDVKPLLFRVDRGDITFFIEDDDVNQIIH